VLQASCAVAVEEEDRLDPSPAMARKIIGRRVRPYFFSRTIKAPRFSPSLRAASDWFPATAPCQTAAGVCNPRRAGRRRSRRPPRSGTRPQLSSRGQHESIS